ncbi:heavy-metal-associated domain-containing protein [Pseudaminobacter sp. NGMCC 1.201702]|uniref:heavy-metal-associated domain-containing protein n=1 Tax=Pseudaminobacter sp. NGMCC 1.201702 TaxID=3391825 RepID=UPI0039F136DE
MLKLNVPDMTCGHCAATITKAVQSVDDKAVVTVDLPTNTVEIVTDAEASRISAALESAGYPTTLG